MNSYQQIISFFDKDQEILQSQILVWMKSDDIKVLGALYNLTNVAWERIKPELEMKRICDFILHYLKRCIIENPESQEYLFNRYEAGGAMANWIKYLWSKRPKTNAILDEISKALKKIYLQGDKSVQDCIVNTVLEHVFEEKAIADVFNDWQQNKDLKAAYEAALEWGDQH